MAATDLLYLRDAYLREFDAVVAAVDEAQSAVALDRTAFYPTGGGQPHDEGVLRWDGGEARVTDVAKRGADAWHVLDGPLPAGGTTVRGELARRGRFVDPVCRESVGWAEGEPTVDLRGVRRRYVFSARPWTQETARRWLVQR